MDIVLFGIALIISVTFAIVSYIVDGNKCKCRGCKVFIKPYSGNE